MRQNRATAGHRSTSTFLLLRVGCIVVVVVLALRSGIDFTPMARLENLPFVISFVLLIPVAMSYEFMQSRHWAPQHLVAFRFGMPGLAMAAVAYALLLSTGILGWPSVLPAFLVILTLVLVWIGAGLLTISNLLLILMFAKFLLARICASA